MKNILRVLIALLLLGAIGSGVWWLYRSPASHELQFGEMNAQRQITTVEDNKITFEVGKFYGWRMTLKKPNGTVVLRSVMTLPDAAEWNFQNNLDGVLKEDRPIKTERADILEAGKVFEITATITAYDEVTQPGQYEIEQGDPFGEYHIDFYLDDKPIDSVTFTIVPPSVISSDETGARDDAGDGGPGL